MKPRKTVASSDAASDDEVQTYQQCLEQAEICREQALNAARLKRFKAACGLFNTAISRCRYAITLGGGACEEASDKLTQLESELSIYADLARSMERPLLVRDNPLAPGVAQSSGSRESG